MLLSFGKRRIIERACVCPLTYLTSNMIERFWRRFWHIQDVQQSRGRDCHESLCRGRESLVGTVSRDCIRPFSSITVRR
jgi:hypothetical protein